MVKQTNGGTKPLDFTRAEEVRVKRTVFTPTPLVRSRRTLLSWIVELFRRKPNPFRASPMATTIDREQQISAREGSAGFSLAPGSLDLEGVESALMRYIRYASKRADKEMEGFNKSLRQEEAWLDQSRPEQIVSSLDSSLLETLSDIKGWLRQHRPILDDAKGRLDRFKTRHELSEDHSPGQPIDRVQVAILGLIILMEFVANAWFQSGILRGGFSQGLVIALFCSALFVALGVGIGRGFQLCAAIDRRRWAGVTLIIVCVAALLWLLSMVSLVRLAGDANIKDPVSFAREQFSLDKFAGFKAMTDFTAFVFAALSCFVVGLMARKYLDFYGNYPEFHGHTLQWHESQVELDAKVESVKTQFTAAGQTHKLQLAAAPDFIAGCRKPLRGLAAGHQEVLDQFKADAQDIETAARLFDAYSRAFHGVADYLRTQVRSELEPKKTEFQIRHTKFIAGVEQLCAREDVSDASVEKEKIRLAALLDQAHESVDKFAGRPPLASAAGA